MALRFNEKHVAQASVKQLMNFGRQLLAVLRWGDCLSCVLVSLLKLSFIDAGKLVWQALQKIATFVFLAIGYAITICAAC